MNQRRQTARNRTAAHSRSQTPSRPFPLTVIITLVLLAAWTIVVFRPAVHYQFVDYDDREAFIDNPHFRGLGPAQVRWMFTTFRMGHYQPLAWMTLGLDSMIARAWFGNELDPRPYHTTNIVLHVLSTLVVFMLARKIFAATSARAWELDVAAALAALFFAVHPLRAESVAWVTERRDVLSSFFLLATVWLYLTAQNAERPRSAFLFMGCLLAYLLSLFSRAMGVTLPLILLLIDIFLLRRLRESRAGGPTTMRRILVEKIPFMLLAAPFIVLAPLAQREVGAAWSWQEHGLLARIAQACYGLIHYLWKTVVPTNLSPIYELTRPLNLSAPKYLVAFIALVVLSGIVWAFRRRFPALVCAAACYVVLLLPVLGFFQSGDQEVADRYSYLPGVVLAVAIAGAILRVWRQRPIWRIPGTLLGIALATALSVLTSRQITIWKDSAALWTYAVRVAPNSAVAKTGLSTVFLEEGRYADAELHARRAIGIVSRNWQANQNLWRALQGQGKEEELIAALQESIRLNVLPEEAHNNLGNAYARRPDYNLAVAEYRAAIALRPRYAKAHANLASILLRQGNLQEAEQEARRAIQADPQLALARFNLGAVLEGLGRRAEAVAAYREAQRLEPQMTAAQRAIQRLGG